MSGIGPSWSSCLKIHLLVFVCCLTYHLSAQRARPKSGGGGGFFGSLKKMVTRPFSGTDQDAQAKGASGGSGGSGDEAPPKPTGNTIVASLQIRHFCHPKSTNNFLFSAKKHYVLGTH